MSDILEELRKVQRLGGDTYSSHEVLGMIGRAADEIERLRAERDQCWGMGWESRNDEIERQRAALDEIANKALTITTMRIVARAALEPKP